MQQHLHHKLILIYYDSWNTYSHQALVRVCRFMFRSERHGMLIVCVSSSDQFFWASRVHKLGAGLRIDGLGSSELSSALVKATSDR